MATILITICLIKEIFKWHSFRYEPRCVKTLISFVHLKFANGLPFNFSFKIKIKVKSRKLLYVYKLKMIDFNGVLTLCICVSVFLFGVFVS